MSRRKHAIYLPPIEVNAPRGLRLEVFGERELGENIGPEWYVRLRWPNGQIFATSEAYSSHSKAMSMARRARAEGIAPRVFDLGEEFSEQRVELANEAYRAENPAPHVNNPKREGSKPDGN